MTTRPDVGWITRAVRAPGTLGLYLGLTGARVTNPADLLYLGLATHYVPEDSWEVSYECLVPADCVGRRQGSAGGGRTQMQKSSCPCFMTQAAKAVNSAWILSWLCC